MAYAIQAGIQVSLDGTTWYKLTDHNRSEIEIKPSLIEKAQRMADGSMRKYVITTKNTISTSWEMLPSKQTLAVDGNYASAWLQAFYNANSGLPVYVKVITSKDDNATFAGYPLESTFGTSLTKSTTYITFITDFSLTTKYRTKNADFVSMSIEFTEI